MFGRKSEAQDSPVEEAHPHREGAKNRPTPKRKDQEAARKQPLVVADRKAARRAEAAKRREAASRQREAMLTGDDKNLPKRDQGPVKRFLRDSVDARRNLGEFVLPVMVLILALSFIKNSTMMLLVFLGSYGIIIASVIDTWLAWRRIKKAAIARFGPSVDLKGGGMYVAVRSFQLRRTRMPRPQVARGEYP